MTEPPRPAGFEILEHTADVGIRAWGPSLGEAFEQAAWGLAEILGARARGPGRLRSIEAEADDEGALLVDLLNELIALHETEEVAFSAIRVGPIGGDRLAAEVETVPIEGEPQGTPVKAATYHQLQVSEHPNGLIEAVVYLDV